MATNPVVWFEVYVEDMERAKNFYQIVLQTKLEKLNNPDLEMWAFPMAQDGTGASGALVKMPVFLPAETALWFISAALIAPPRLLAS